MTVVEDLGHSRATIESITAALQASGWKAEAGEGWVNHTFDNGYGELRVRYLPPGRELILDFESDRHVVQLDIGFDSEAEEVLEAITRHQHDLSAETWEAFIVDLLLRSRQVIGYGGEDGEEPFVLESVEDGVDALLEVEWQDLAGRAVTPPDVHEGESSGDGSSAARS